MTGKTFPAYPAHAHPQFCVSGKRPMGKPCPHPMHIKCCSTRVLSLWLIWHVLILSQYYHFVNTIFRTIWSSRTLTNFRKLEIFVFLCIHINTSITIFHFVDFLSNVLPAMEKPKATRVSIKESLSREIKMEISTSWDLYIEAAPMSQELCFFQRRGSVEVWDIYTMCQFPWPTENWIRATIFLNSKLSKR